MEIVSRAEIGRWLGVSREAVPLWRQRPGFPEPVSKIDLALIWDWEEVCRWVEKRSKHATNLPLVMAP